MAINVTKILLGLLVLAAAVMAPPAVAGSVLAGAAGLLLMATATVPSPVVMPVLPEPVPIRAQAPIDSVRVFEVSRGLVVFHTVDGKLVSRFIRT